MAATSSLPVAASPMLSIPEKKTSSVDIYGPLREYIVSTFSEKDAASVKPDLVAVRQMRSELEKPLPDNSRSSLDFRLYLLQCYHRALSVIKSRLTVPPSVAFTWNDAFKTNRKATQKSVDLERAALVFNIGAVHSQIGVAINRASEEGRKQALTEFEKAAGAFVWLKQMVAARKVGTATVDLTAECAEMLEKLMLAQAQECYFEKMIADSKPALLCSKVAKQVFVYYEQAYTLLLTSPLNQHFDREWVSHIQLKAGLFFGEACFLYSKELHEKQQFGEEIARLKKGTAAIADTKRIARGGGSASLLQKLALLESAMNQSLARAVKDNGLIYLNPVPAANSLTVLPATDLAKPIPMAETLDFSKEMLFSTLVPDFIMKVLTRYSDMVDEEVIREQADKIQQTNEIARSKLNELGLPNSILSLGGELRLPTELREGVEAIQARGGPSGLELELQQLRDLRAVNQGLMAQIEESLLKESTEDSLYRAQFRESWTRPESGDLTNSLQERLSQLGEELAQARVSDESVEQSVNDNYEAMAILDSRPIESTLPKPPVSLHRAENDVVETLKQRLSQLETLGVQRARLEDMLRELKAKDDVLPKLMKYTGIQEALFKNEIGKYNKICEDIGQNIRKQGPLLSEIQALNDKLAAFFNLAKYKAEYEKSYEQIRAGIAKYREIKENISDRIKFYVTLQDSLKDLMQHSNDFVLTRNIQGHDLIEILISDSTYLKLGEEREINQNT